MERYCLELVHSTWLASPISCCFPQRLQDQPQKSEPAAPGITVDTTTEVCTEQPALQRPPVFHYDSERSISQISCRPPTAQRPSISQRHSSWLREGRSLPSRPKSPGAMSFTRRRRTGRRPTIGAPFEFKKVQSSRIPHSRQVPSFRPLQLSIYLPGNELPELPIFWNEDDLGEDDEEEVGLDRPTKALVKSKSDPILLRRPSSSFSIPRKPVASRSSSIDTTSRFSMNSCFAFNTLNDLGPQSKSRPTDRLRSGSIERRQSVATTQEFIDALDCQFPRPPPPAALRSSPNTPESGFTIYRKASEQSLRLRTHLEERISLEKRLPDLLEEVSPVSPVSVKMIGLSPIADQDNREEADDAPAEGPSVEKHWYHSTALAEEHHHETSSSSRSSTLLNPPTPLMNDLRSDAEITPPLIPSVTTTVSAETQFSLRNRLSQWLLKALPLATTTEPFIQERRTSTPLSFYSLSAYTYELPRAHTKQSSMSSSYWTRASIDVEKALVTPVLGVTNVGVAF